MTWYLLFSKDKRFYVLIARLSAINVTILLTQADKELKKVTSSTRSNLWLRRNHPPTTEHRALDSSALRFAQPMASLTWRSRTLDKSG
jgi:hypothetical protein